MKSEIQRIINTLKHAYEKNAWHGPAVKEVLQPIDAKKATRKIGESHSIIDLVMHMAAWRNFVVQKLKGNASFDLNDEQNFPQEKDWKKALTMLEKSQDDLIEMLEKTSDDKLQEIVPGRNFKFYVMLHGIIHHDLYHLGQIQLIAKYS